MNKINITITSAILLFAACEEIGPAIDFTPVDETLIDTSYIELPAEAPQTKVVLLEDFTGVQCVNCPDAHEATAELLATYPDQLVVVAEHNYFAGPYSDSYQDLGTPEAEELDDYLGPAPAWPAGFVDRKDFGTGTLYTLFVSNYAVYVEDQLPLVPACNLYLEATYDDASAKALVKVTIKYTSDVTSVNHLSVMILENGIVDLQSTNDGIDAGYVHDHVLRDMLTPATGVLLNDELTAGRVFVKEFSISVPDTWDPDKLDIVAFVHNFSDTDKEVLQAASSHLE